MGRPRTPDPIDQARRLHEAKAMIAESARATPAMAGELRRGAVETLAEIIAELATPARIRKAVGTMR